MMQWGHFFAPFLVLYNASGLSGGLPGLILKVYDTNRLYTFEAVGIERGKHPIQQYEYKGYKKRTRAEVQKYQRTFTENWLKAVGWRSGTVDAGGHVVLGEAVSKFTPYEPLEKV